MSNRLAPLIAPFPPDVAERLAQYPQRDGYILNLFRTFANSRRFMTRAVANLLDRDSPLGIRRREIAILRTTAKLDCEYEWGVHVAAYAAAAALTPEQVAATRHGDAESSCWNESEQLLARVIDELCETAEISPPTYARVAECLTKEEQLEIIAICGNYHTICFVAKTARLDLEPFAARFSNPVSQE